MAYKGRVGGGVYMAQKSRTSIAVVGVVRMGGGNKGMIASCTHKTVERISCIGQDSSGAAKVRRGADARRGGGPHSSWPPKACITS